MRFWDDVRLWDGQHPQASLGGAPWLHGLGVRLESTVRRLFSSGRECVRMTELDLSCAYVKSLVSFLRSARFRSLLIRARGFRKMGVNNIKKEDVPPDSLSSAHHLEETTFIQNNLPSHLNKDSKQPTCFPLKKKMKTISVCLPRRFNTVFFFCFFLANSKKNIKLIIYQSMDYT